MRDKLIELLTDNLPRCGNLPHWDNPLQLSCDEQVGRIADHLLANGVIVPPCKVGQTVWFIRKDIKSEIVETNVEKIVLKHGGLYIKLGCNSMYETTCNSIGKTVFLTKEEAEKVLAERGADND